MDREGTEDRPKPTVRGVKKGNVATFGTILRELREAGGLTQEELASRAGLTAKAVSALERGERKRPYPHTVRSLAEALGLSDDERASLFAAVPSRSAEAAASSLQVTSVQEEQAGRPDAAAPSSTVALAAPQTSLVGREKELSEIESFLRKRGVRLLTLTDTGGVGKTRLALEVARLAYSLFDDGAAF